MRNRLEEYTNNLNSHLSDKNLFYFVRNPERGLGLETLLNNFHIIYIQSSQYTEYFDDSGINSFCLECNSGQSKMCIRDRTSAVFLV